MTILDDIVSLKREEVKQLRKRFRYRHFADFAYFERPAIGLESALKITPDLAIIAEIKKASPSAGIIRSDFDPVEQAQIYFENGAEAISVLTDQRFFQGSLQSLEKIAAIRQKPVLRKDFIIDDMQVFESKAFGADAILLIAEILSASQIQELISVAREVGVDVLLELHGSDQLPKLPADYLSLIGINNRNLADFSISLDTTTDLLKVLPEGITCVSESGINGKDAVDMIKATRVDAILVGEYLMRQEDSAQALRQLKEWCHRAC